MYTCGECGWTGDNPDEWTHDLFEYVQGCEGSLICIPIGSCPGKDDGADEDYTCGASIFEPTALAEMELFGEMLAVLERIQFRHRGIDPEITTVVGKARRLGWSPQRSRVVVDINLKG